MTGIELIVSESKRLLEEEGLTAVPDAMSEMRICPGCKRQVPRSEMTWTHDRYGIPWKLCCLKCVERIAGEISEWVFDPVECGESLEES